MNNQNKREVTKISKKKKEKRDSSDISSYDSDNDNVTNADIQKEAREAYMQTELLERITKYLKIDNNIKDKKKELQEFMKAAKKQKEEMEKYIIGYLTEVQEEYIKIDGEGKLTKTVSIRKGAIKPENIKDSVKNGLKRENINLDEKKFNEVLGSILGFIEDSRPTTSRTYIKRTQIRQPTNNKETTKESKHKHKQKEEDSSDEELPKYKK
jgi:hypothetical protein